MERLQSSYKCIVSEVETIAKQPDGSSATHSPEPQHFESRLVFVISSIRDNTYGFFDFLFSEHLPRDSANFDMERIESNIEGERY